MSLHTLTSCADFLILSTESGKNNPINLKLFEVYTLRLIDSDKNSLYNRLTVQL